MDSHRFDELTRILARGVSRRGALRGLVGGLLVATPTSLRSGKAQQSCPDDQVFRRGVGCVCRTTGRPPINGQCPCPSGQTACDGNCVSCRSNQVLVPETCQCCIPNGGSGCADNADCCSGVCAGRTCIAGPQEPGGQCDEPADCASGLCCGTTCASTDFDGWTPTSAGTASVSVECGPGTTPIPPESARFSVGSDGNSDAQLRNSAYNGLLLSSLTQLSYSTYVQQDGSGGQAPYIMLRVDYDGNGTQDDILFFEPVYQSAAFFPSNPQGPLAVGVWQTWDALNGGWWSVNGTAGATPGTGVKSLATIIAAQPSAALATSTEGIRITVGFGAGAWDDFVGNVDNVNVNGTTYDF